MSETNKIMTSIQFPNTQEPYNINDARIPQNPDPYMQLVTDGEGKAGWEQRLAWKEEKDVSITWDGNTDGLPSASLNGMPMLYKVSDATPSNDEIKNASTALTVRGQQSDVLNIADDWDTLVSAGLVTDDIVIAGVEGEPAVIVVRTAGTTWSGMTFSETGVYFVGVPVADTDYFNHTSLFVYNSETTHPIPAEYLPQPIVFSCDAVFTSVTCEKDADEVISILKGNPMTDVWLRSSTGTEVALHAVQQVVADTFAMVSFLFPLGQISSLQCVDVTVQDGAFTISAATLVGDGTAG